MQFTYEAPEEHRGSGRINPNREPTREEIWNFLDMLRDTGKTNMLAAPEYIEFYLDIPKRKAKEAFWDWVDRPNKRRKLAALLNS